MRLSLIIAVIILMALGCNKKDDDGTSKLPESKVAKGQEADAVQELKQSPVAHTDDSAKKDKISILCLRIMNIRIQNSKTHFPWATQFLLYINRLMTLEKLWSFISRSFRVHPPNQAARFISVKQMQMAAVSP